jgi:cystathionine gamma-synthase
LFPSKRIAEKCRAFLLDRSSQAIQIRLIQFLICPEGKGRNSLKHDACGCAPCPVSSPCAELHIVLFPEDAFSLAKEFWQHSGTGISSRLAEYCLSMLHEESIAPQTPSLTQGRFIFKNKHYSVKDPTKTTTIHTSLQPPTKNQGDDTLSADQNVYVEERYGRNLPVSSAASAKRVMRRRIAGILVKDNIDGCLEGPYAAEQDMENDSGPRGIADISEDDVYLFPSGMSAIWNAHQLALTVRPPSKSICFGFVVLYLGFRDSSYVLLEGSRTLILLKYLKNLDRVVNFSDTVLMPISMLWRRL